MSSAHQASVAYKHAVLSYLALAGPTQELSVFHLKLLDVIDMKTDNATSQPDTELAMQAFVLAKRVALYVSVWLNSEAIERREPRLGGLRLRLLDKLALIDETPELERCRAAHMLLCAANMALQKASAITNIKHPDLERLKP